MVVCPHTTHIYTARCRLVLFAARGYFISSPSHIATLNADNVIKVYGFPELVRSTVAVVVVVVVLCPGPRGAAPRIWHMVVMAASARVSCCSIPPTPLRAFRSDPLDERTAKVPE